MSEPIKPSETPAPTMDQAFDEAVAESTEQEHVGEAPVEPDKSSEASEPSFTDIDPKTLPPELQKTYKNLQAGFTRKMQELAEQRKSIEQERKFNEAWRPFQEAYNTDPAIRARVDKALEMAEEAAIESGATTPDEFAAFLEKYDPADHETLKSLKATIEKTVTSKFERELSALKQELSKTVGQVDGVKMEQLRRDAEVEARKFEKKYPDWRENLTPRQQKIFHLELMERPDATPAEIYEEIVSEFESLSKKAESQTLDKLIERANKKPTKPSLPKATSVEKVDSIDEAFEAAMRELS